ncbi:hypothetical protein BDV93DRAFT_73818 [Ceratobasidium sp. AG-I]|nr:hypothetical protein BDV93DRAFT_73818 [Ceratobasidium sp. AG-I]
MRRAGAVRAAGAQMIVTFVCSGSDRGIRGSSGSASCCSVFKPKTSDNSARFSHQSLQWPASTPTAPNALKLAAPSVLRLSTLQTHTPNPRRRRRPTVRHDPTAVHHGLLTSMHSTHSRQRRLAAQS